MKNQSCLAQDFSNPFEKQSTILKNRLESDLINGRPDVCLLDHAASF